MHNPLSNYRYSNSTLHSAPLLSAGGSYDYEKLECSRRVMELDNAAEILPTVALQNRQGTEPGNTYNRPIIDYIWMPLLEGYSSSKQ